MENKNCFIEFEINTEENYNDLKHTFELIKEAKNSGRPKGDEFWLTNFPDYVLRQFHFLDNDLKPTFKTASEGKFTWHFYSLTNLLQVDYDLEYTTCSKLSKEKGRIEYQPFGYPYGGISGLVTFIAAFNCKPSIVDDGTSLYKITFLETGDFSLIDLNDPNHQDSSINRFNAIELLRKFTRRLK